MWGQITAVFAVTKLGELKHDLLLNLNQVVLVSKPHQTLNTAVSQHKIENWTFSKKLSLKFHHIYGFAEMYIAIIYSADWVE